jgi:hydrogenase maturation protein HypF
VLTSGNLSDEPIAYTDDEAFSRLGGIADAFLTHDRPIHARTDDSVMRVRAGRVTPVRRSRGYAPRPLTLPVPASRQVLGCGAELKSTFCLAAGAHAFVSSHIGDLENYQTLRSYADGIEHLRRLLGISPQVVAHDLHPEYLSTKYALELDEVELVGVQHHHAHIASCLADNGVDEQVIGVAFDGLGYGTDGTLWGGEFLLADLRDFTRIGRLAPVPLPGGSAAVREPWRMAAAYLDAAGHRGFPEVAARQGERWAQIVSMARSGLNAPLTSSAGRLFDAVAAILGVRDTATYEGQAAIELEQCADPSVLDAHPVRISGGEPFLVHGSDLVLAVLADMREGVPRPVAAARFHNGVAGAIVAACLRLRTATGITSVALSGGVFQNQFLLDRTIPALVESSFRVLTHRHVPPNDGGISLGQAAVAAARDHAAR